MTFFVVAAGVLGLIFGSFATAVAYRLPRNESISKGRSKCPNCGNTISAIQNVPVFSYVVLRGRCKHCGNRISIRYPLIELATGALFAGAAAKFEVSAEALLYAGFFWALVVLTVIDLEYKLLPNRIVFPLFIAGWIGLTVAALAAGEADRLVDAAIGAAIFGGFFFLVAYVYPAGMGFGDVKLAFALGTFLGYLDGAGLTLVAMFLSFLIGGIIGVAVLAASKGDRKTQLPFGPFLALGTVIAIFVGEKILDAYLGTF
ncbi:MAG TPA: prepilin peptidase [Actinomycetota bacterium]|nr:prepilin peptidase [Actinomycetota bacterium]